MAGPNVSFQVDLHLHATLQRTPAQLALEQELVRLSAVLRTGQRPPSDPQAAILLLNGCLASMAIARRFVPGRVECAMECVQSVLACLRLAPQYLVRYEERARCAVCQADRAQVRN